MKKIKILGITATVFLVLTVAALSATAFLGVFNKDTEENEIVLTPEKIEKNRFVPEGGKTVLFKTEEGEIKIELGTCEAAEEFLKLVSEGAFANAEFSTLVTDMFIQASANGSGFAAESSGYGCFYGSVGLVTDGKTASPGFFIITAKKLSGISKAYLSEKDFDKEKAALYEELGGVPEYEGKVIIFGKVVSGMEVAEKIAAGENSGYTGGYSAAEPVKIISAEILPSE